MERVILGLLVAGSILVSPAQAARFKRECIVISGPVNLHESPGGKILRPIPDQSTMFAEELDSKTGDGWIRVRAFADRASKSIRCSNSEDGPDGPVSGWIPRPSRKEVTRAQAMEIDRLGFLQGWMSTSNDYSDPERAVAKVETTCGVFSRNARGQILSSVTQVFVPGAEIGKECLEGDDAVTCRWPVTGGADYTVCVTDDVQTKGAKSLGDKDRRKALADAANEARTHLAETLSEEFLKKVAAKYPEWIPLLMPHPKRNTDYVYDLALVPSAARAKFGFKDGKPKDRQVLVFYASLDDAVAGAPQLAFEYGDEVEFRKLPLNLRPAKDAPAWEDRPTLCLASSGGFIALNACRVLEEHPELVGSVDFRADPASTIEEDDMKKALGRLKSGVCCNWNDKKYIQLLPKKE